MGDYEISLFKANYEFMRMKEAFKVDWGKAPGEQINRKSCNRLQDNLEIHKYVLLFGIMEGYILMLTYM